MKILHGEDANKSYGRLQIITDELKTKGFEVESYDISELDITNLRQKLSSSELFALSKCIVIKNLLGSTKSKNVEKIINILNQETNHEIILWENKTITPTVLKKLPKANVENFTISPVIFKFLDSLKPNNSKNILLSWKKLQEEGIEPEFVFNMIVRQIKLLIQAKSGPSLIKLPPYPKRLITQQATYFSVDQLLNMYHWLFIIDIKIKTGMGGNTIYNLITNFLQKI